jgi:hypothetical protein
MKETEMHRSFPQWEIRQLIAHDLREVSYMEMDNKQVVARYDNEHIWDYIIEDSKNAIKFHQQRIKIAELRKGLLMVIEMRGWQEFDISDENIRIEPGQKLYLEFIGTEAEHKELLKSVYSKK